MDSVGEVNVNAALNIFCDTALAAIQPKEHIKYLGPWSGSWCAEQQLSDGALCWKYCLFLVAGTFGLAFCAIDSQSFLLHLSSRQWCTMFPLKWHGMSLSTRGKVTWYHISLMFKMQTVSWRQDSFSLKTSLPRRVSVTHISWNCAVYSDANNTALAKIKLARLWATAMCKPSLRATLFQMPIMSALSCLVLCCRATVVHFYPDATRRASFWNGREQIGRVKVRAGETG